MDAGQMRHKIVIQRLSESRNELGEPEGGWEDVASLRASVNPLSGRDFMAALKEQTEITHKVTIRYTPSVRAHMRVLFGERVLRILHVIDTRERHHEMVLMCKELV